MGTATMKKFDTPIYDEYVTGEILARAINIPKSLRKGQFHIVYDPAPFRSEASIYDKLQIDDDIEFEPKRLGCEFSEANFEQNEVVDVKSLAGILSQYANPSKIETENDGWKIAMKDKYGLS